MSKKIDMHDLAPGQRALFDQYLADGTTSMRHLLHFGRDVADCGEDAVFLRIAGASMSWLNESNAVKSGTAARLIGALVTEVLRRDGSLQ